MASPFSPHPVLLQNKDILTFDGLTQEVKKTFIQFPDSRTGKNTKYRVEDAALSAFSVFFMQSPSFLDYQTTMVQSQGQSNAQTWFGVHNIPCDNQIRKLLDSVAPENVFPLFWNIVDALQERAWLDNLRSIGGTLLVPFDGTQYFSSQKIHCEHCSTRQHQKKTTYFHQVVTPVIVAPNQSQVIPLAPEFIQPQDGHQKQDCELNASKRWLQQWGNRLRTLRVTILSDDLYSHQPFCEVLLAQRMDFLLVCKPDSHVTVSEWVDYLEKIGEVKTLVKKRWTGKRYETDTYRYAQQIPLRDDDDILRVNWCELTTVLDNGTIVYRNAFITSHQLDDKSVVEAIRAGRTRWKIENENHNVLKTKGYHFDHNFGHGQHHLAALLATLIILAFLLHTRLELMDEDFKLLRQQLPSRQRLFNDWLALTTYFYFDSWSALLTFMLQGRVSRHPIPT
jgi:hypothetical protein